MKQPATVENSTYPNDNASSAYMIGAARLLVENARIYANHLAVTESGPYVPDAFNETLNTFLDLYYELAKPQLPEWLIDRRLRIDDEQADFDDLFGAVDAELAVWQQGGLVTSQTELLQDFTNWLYSQHTPDALEVVQDEAVERALRRNAVFASRLIKLR